MDVREQVWDDFARSLRRKGRSAATVRLYRKSFDSFFALHDVDPGEVTTGLVNEWTDSLARLKPSGRALLWRNLRPFFSWYAREWEVPNPFDRADAPTADSGEVTVVSLEDRRALVQACKGRGFDDRRDEAIIRIFVDTGARLGEMVNLQVADWDRRVDFLTLRGKTGMRVVPLSASTGEALARYLRVRRQHPDSGRPEMWLGRKGPLRESGIAQLLRRRCRQARVAPINPHRFRHTWAHEFRDQGGSEGDLMYLAGWSSTAMAHRYGRSAAAERARRAARALSLGDRL